MNIRDRIYFVGFYVFFAKWVYAGTHSWLSAIGLVLIAFFIIEVGHIIRD